MKNMFLTLFVNILKFIRISFRKDIEDKVVKIANQIY